MSLLHKAGQASRGEVHLQVQGEGGSTEPKGNPCSAGGAGRLVLGKFASGSPDKVIHDNVPGSQILVLVAELAG